MHIHILGICGTFMGSLAVLAKEQGHRVTGCDQNVYPPMSTQLEQQGIELIEGFSVEQLALEPDLYVVGNAISRGNPLLEEILNKGLPYTSGPQMLSEHVLPGKWVLAVAGTHGKTTTTAMLSWILEYAGMSPGFLIGGVPKNFDCSARLGDTPFFVIEADEYDSAFFDKRSKFVHYRPKTFIFNNLEFDHADIFSDLAAIQTQFHHVIRTIPQLGRIIYPGDIEVIDQVLDKGVWCETESFVDEQQSGKLKGGESVSYQMNQADGSEFEVQLSTESYKVHWQLTGKHNVCNGIAALLAARHVGVELSTGVNALSEFEGVKRRMELIGENDTVKAYDDFAHHPTAIQTTLEGIRNRVGSDSVIAVIEPRSNTMKMGVHEDTLLASAEAADRVIWANLGGLDWLGDLLDAADSKHVLCSSVDAIIGRCMSYIGSNEDQCSGRKTHVVFMSNGGFAGIHAQFLSELQKA